MQVFLAIARQTFETAIARTIARNFRTSNEKVKLEKTELNMYLDGIQVHGVTVSKDNELTSIILNEVKDDKAKSIGQIDGEKEIFFKAITASLNATFFLVNAGQLDVTAGSHNPRMAAAGGLPIQAPTLRVGVWVECAKGVAVLRGEVLDSEIDGFEIPPESRSFKTYLNLGAGFAGLRPSPELDDNDDPIPYDSRLLNAALVLDSSLNAIIRAEFVPTPGEESQYGIAARRAGWSSFGSQPPEAMLGGRDWAVAVPLKLVAESVWRRFDEGLKESAEHFDYFDDAQVWVSGSSFVLRASGEIPKVCAVLEPDVKLAAQVSLEVPAVNVLQARIKIEYDVNDDDAHVCVGMTTLLFPVLGAITAIELERPWHEYALGCAVSLGFPVLATVGALVVLWSGEADGYVDESVGAAISKNMKGKITPVGKLEFIMAAPFETPVVPEIAALQIHEVTSFAGMALVRGECTAEHPIMPVIDGCHIVQPFSPWLLDQNCDTPPTEADYQCFASVRIDIEGDDGDPEEPGTTPEGETPLVANIPWMNAWDQYGANPIVIDDPDHIFSFDPPVANHLFIRARRPKNELYDCRLRFVTNGGVREMTIPLLLPPPPLPFANDPIGQTTAWMKWKGQHCWKAAQLLLSRHLEVLWLPYPPLREDFGQIWQTVVQGLKRDDVLRVFDRQSHRLLAEFIARDEVVNASFALPPDRVLDGIQLTLNERRPLSSERYAAFARRVGTPEREPGLKLWMKQSLAAPTGRIEAPEGVAGLRLRREEDRVVLVALFEDGSQIDYLVRAGLAPVPLKRRQPEQRQRWNVGPRLPSRVSLAGRQDGERFQVTQAGASPLDVAGYHGVTPPFHVSSAGRHAAFIDVGGKAIIVADIARTASPLLEETRAAAERRG